MANNQRYIEILNAVAEQEGNRLITIIIFGIVLIFLTVLLPAKFLTLKFKRTSKKHSKKQKNNFCFKPVFVILSFVILISGVIYKTVEIKRINDDIREKNFIVYEGTLQYDSLYHDYYYGRIDFMDKNQKVTDYAFYADKTNSHNTYPDGIGTLPENQDCKGVIVYSAKSKIVVDIKVTKE